MTTLLNRICTLCETETWLEGGFVQCDCLTVPEYEWSMGVIETPKQWNDDVDALEKVHYMPPGSDRQRNRSRTYPGIAAAFAQQWGGAV